MKEIQVIKYQAEDGKMFNTKEECEKYETRFQKVKEILNLIPVVKEICAENGECSYCPFYKGFGCCFGYDEETVSENAPCNSWSW